MTLQLKITLYLIALHVALAVCAFTLLRELPAWFAVAELALALSLLVGYRLVRAFFLPLELIRTGTELLREREFGSHFRPVGQTEMDRLVSIYNDMADQLRQERLKHEEQNLFLKKILDASPAGVLTLDPDGAVQQLNAAAMALLGIDLDAVGHPLSRLPAPFAIELPKLSDGGSTVVQIRTGRRLRVRRASFYDRGAERGFFLIEELTEELQASERSAYGKLIRMMSHEVNNSVGVVRSLLDSCAAYETQLDNETRGDFTQAIDVAIGRLLHLNSFMNGLARVVRIPPPERRPCDLTRLLSDVVLLIRPELERREIEISWTPPPIAVTIDIDKNQIEQVIVNILQNAMEAIGTRGRLGIRLSPDELTVRDSGPGIAAEAAGKLFTPFYSTKKDGQGVGLMLSREILSQHGFDFSLNNAAEGGAEFRIGFRGQEL
jgi:signal transduction histidine kinase